jgi:ribose 5-phosphate isomerase B
LLTINKLAGYTIEWTDVGCSGPERTDYPPFAFAVADRIRQERVDRGILLCGTGIGVAIAANRCSRVYAGLVWNAEIARKAREDDNINVLVLPADYITQELALACVEQWLDAKFKGGRYQERISMIDQYQGC